VDIGYHEHGTPGAEQHRLGQEIGLARVGTVRLRKDIQIMQARHLGHGAGGRIRNVERARGIVWNAKTSCRDLELVENNGGMINASLVLSAHHNSRSLGGDHHGIHGLIDAGDSIEMGFEEPGDRCGAFNQGAGRPIDGKENSDILEHAGWLSGYKGLISPPCNYARGWLRRFDLSHAWQRTGRP